MITGSLLGYSLAIDSFVGFGMCHRYRLLDKGVRSIVLLSGNLRAKLRGRGADRILSFAEKSVKGGRYYSSPTLWARARVRLPDTAP